MADVTDDPPDVLKTRQQWADDLLDQANSPMEYASTRNEDKIRELEERIRQLEARPYPIVQPYPVPAWPGDNSPGWLWPNTNSPPPWRDPSRYRTWC